ncbi:DNA repair protein RAD51 homolog 4 isoform X2 [Dendrobates tinctorius]|uniref:DNA repair protein RAD51 homolog 4 isoform X2 n=1 Tax=Dendrobates tinctorius TaxID=92724 RepID=UPI003CC98B79
MVILREGLCPGLTADIITLLKKNHVRTVVDLVASDLEELARKCSLSYKTLVAVRRVLLAQYSAFPSNGADLYEELKASTAILPTGNKKLDFLLDSGLYTGEVTEIAGAPGSGKTQVASLERIQVIRIFDAYKLLDVLQDLRHSFSQQLLRSGETLRLVVVDSACAVIYPLLGGKQTEGMAVMMYIAKELQTLAHDFSLAVLVTNHITKDGSAGFRPALGRSWSFVPSTRIQIHRDESNKQNGNRLMSLVKSSRQPTNLQVEVEIGLYGILEENVSTACGL